MDTLLEIALVGLWIVISVVALSRAFNSAGLIIDHRRPDPLDH
jgi:hypothetical protein